jgi:hypothetical protein
MRTARPQRTSTEPWTSVGTQRDNEIVQLVVEPAVAYSDIEIVACGPATVTPTAVTQATTDLKITGGTYAGEAQIEARSKATGKTLARLNVMVLEWKILDVGIYRITDPNNPSGTTPASDNDASNGAIIGTLNTIFKQACVEFQEGETFPTNIVYDGVCTSNCQTNARLEPTEFDSNVVTLALSWAGPIRLLLFKNTGYDGARGVTRMGWPYNWYSLLFTADCYPLTDLAATHETGHQLNLSASPFAYEWHDFGPVPAGTAGLMVPYLASTWYWMRQEDWLAANTTAHNK